MEKHFITLDEVTSGMQKPMVLAQYDYDIGSYFLRLLYYANSEVFKFVVEYFELGVGKVLYNGSSIINAVEIYNKKL